jgi:hypothetical protein
MLLDLITFKFLLARPANQTTTIVFLCQEKFGHHCIRPIFKICVARAHKHSIQQLWFQFVLRNLQRN